MNGIVRYERPKTAVEIRREMVKIPDVVSKLSGLERSVLSASTAKTVSEYNGVELTAELRANLKWIMKDVGYRVTNEDDNNYLVVRIAEILRRYYGDFTLKDFRLSFEMCMNGELDEFLPKGRDNQPDRSHYQNFNAEYVGKVMSAYKSRRRQILKRAVEVMPKQEPKKDPEEVRRIEKSIRKELVWTFLFYKYCGRLPETITLIGEMLYYEILESVGLADDVVVTEEERQYVLRKSISSLSVKGQFSEARRVRDAGKDSEEIKFKAYVIGRRKALESAFEYICQNELQIKDYING